MTGFAWNQPVEYEGIDDSGVVFERETITPAANPLTPLDWPEPTHRLALPVSAVYGWAARKAVEIGGPPDWGYVALLTVHAGQGVNKYIEHPNPRPTLYTVLVGPPYLGKSTMMERAIMALQGSEHHVLEATPASSEGLALLYPRYQDKERKIENPLPSSVLVVDELGDLLKRTQYQGSTLGDTLNTLWYRNGTTISSAKGVRETHVWLSILGGLPAQTTDEFRDAFQGTQTGLRSRLIVCPAPAKWSWDHRLTIRTEHRKPRTVSIADDAYQIYRRWVAADAARGRLGEIGLRVAVLSASLNGESTVNVECMTCAMEFAAWQEKVAAVYIATNARNDDALVTEAILNAINREARYKKGPDKGRPMYIRWRDLYRKGHWERYGGSLVRRVREALIADNMIDAEMDSAYDEFGKQSGREKWTGRVRPKDEENEL